MSHKSESAKLRKTHCFLEHTTRVWQPRSGRHLTPEDAREIISNASGFFDVLDEWNRRSSKEVEQQAEGTVNDAR